MNQQTSANKKIEPEIFKVETSYLHFILKIIQKLFTIKVVSSKSSNKFTEIEAIAAFKEVLIYTFYQKTNGSYSKVWNKNLQ